jgi:drug/metabolite transporter (DMT)-like permease
MVRDGNTITASITILLMLVWGSCFIVIKAGLVYFPPLFFAGLRALGAGVVLLVVASLLKDPWPEDRKVWVGIIFLAVFNTTVSFAGMFLSVETIGAGIASVLSNTQPLIVAVPAFLLFGESLGLRRIGGLFLGLLGTSLVVGATQSVLFSNGWSREVSMAGVLWALTAAGGISVGTLVAKVLSEKRQLVQIAGWQFVLGGVPLLAWSFYQESLSSVSFTPASFGLFLYLAVVGTAAAYVLWFYLLQRGEVTQVASYTFLVPVFGLVLSVIQGGETLQASEILGMALILGGIVMVTLREKTRSSAESFFANRDVKGPAKGKEVCRG